MEYLRRMERHAAARPEAPAIRTSDGEEATYGELWQASESLAALIDESGVSDRKPVVVYGHKSPLMVACFHACLKSGHPYVPIDMHSVPHDRVANIIGQIGEPLVLAVEALPELDVACAVLDRASIEAALSSGRQSDRSRWVAGEDLAYILFTSGSTGAPKGVQVTADCIDNFCLWAVTLGGTDKTGQAFLNQAPFSFDLSVYELAMSFWSGGTLFCLTKGAQDSPREQFAVLASSGVQVWVSTPSFAEVCLAEKSFDASMMPDVEIFLFCGETLLNSTALRLQERFPHAVVLNTYGPTESTVAVTEVAVTPQLAAGDTPLPVGRPRPGTRIRIVGEDGSNRPTGSYGEIVIEGDTVSRGYFGRDDLTEQSFGTTRLDGKTVRTYRTGDEGCLDDAGMLHYRGRLDLQIKLNGFRIELGDIEENLRRLPQVKGAVVVPAMKDGRISHLVAHVVSAVPRTESDFREGLALKEALKSDLPHYMIPKKVVFHDLLPMTPNGKIDRKALAAR